MPPGTDLRRTAWPYKAVLLAAALLAFGLLFRELVTLLVAILITVLIAIPLSSAATRLERYRVPRFIGALLGLLVGVGVLVGVLALVIPPFVGELELFVDEVPTIIDDLESSLGGLLGSSQGADAQEFLQGYVDDPSRLVGPLTSIGFSVATLFGAILLILITAYYMAVRPQPLLDGIASLLPPSRRAWGRHVMDRLHDAWIGWMQGMVADMLITGVLLYIGLTIIGLEFAIFFAVLTALLSVVPYFGAIASGIPPVLFAFTDSPGKALLVIFVYILVQQIEGNLTIPMVMARAVNLHPAVIAIGVLVVGQLFGFVGLIVAVPILSMITILVEDLWVKPIEEAHRRAGESAIVKA